MRALGEAEAELGREGRGQTSGQDSDRQLPSHCDETPRQPLRLRARWAVLAEPGRPCERRTAGSGGAGAGLRRGRGRVQQEAAALGLGAWPHGNGRKQPREDLNFTFPTGSLITWGASQFAKRTPVPGLSTDSHGCLALSDTRLLTSPFKARRTQDADSLCQGPSGRGGVGADKPVRGLGLPGH